jgi:hypothetical protein
LKPKLNPSHSQKRNTADASYDILAVVSLKSQVCQDVTLCDWLCINQYFKGTYCLELQDQAVMETLSGREDEYTVLLHNIGTAHPMILSHPKRTESCCLPTDTS